MDNEQLQKMIVQADRLYAGGHSAEAMAVYQGVLAEAPDHPWALSRTGALMAQKGDLESAEAVLTKALELDPQLAAAHSNLGNVYFARGDYDRALTKYKEAIAINPDNPIYHQNLHAAYKKQGKIAEAVAALKQSQRLNRTKAKDEALNAYRGVKGRFGCLGGATLLVLLSASLVLLVLH